jgi:hypothetical protein
MRLTERQRWEFLPALCVTLWAGCANPASTQVISGRIAASDSALAVRALDDDTVVTAAQVRSDGSFTLALPRGSQYRLEVLTAGGVKHLALPNGGQFDELTFKVCQPAAPWDVGVIASPPQVGNVGGGCDPATDPLCKCAPDGTCTSPDGAAAPDEVALRSQQAHRLAAALDELPHDLRVVYVLCELEDMPGVEAARALDVRPGTLWRRLHEARRALRDAIEGGA